MCDGRNCPKSNQYSESLATSKLIKIMLTMSISFSMQNETFGDLSHNFSSENADPASFELRLEYFKLCHAHWLCLHACANIQTSAWMFTLENDKTGLEPFKQFPVIFISFIVCTETKNIIIIFLYFK